MASPAGRLVAVGIGLILLSAAASDARAAQPEASRLHLRVGDFDPLVSSPALPQGLRLTPEPGSGYFIVQFDRGIDEPLLERLRRIGVQPLSYMPNRAYLVRVPEGKKEELLGARDVRWMGAVQPGWKLSPELGRRPFEDASRRELGRVYATIDLYEGEDLETAKQRVTDLGIEVLSLASFSDTRRLKVHASLSQLESAARIPAVSWIEEVGEAVLRNNDVRWVVQSNEPGSNVLWMRGLHGEGQIVGHIDGPIYLKSCFFADSQVAVPGPTHRKLVGYRSFGNSSASHGTHTAGTLAGDPSPLNQTLEFAGVAYEARISHSDLAGVTGINGPPSNLYDLFAAAHADGARVHTNSWGDDSTDAYTAWSRDVDLFAYDYEDSLPVFAVSNSRVIRSPENAKNLLAVGATFNGALADQHCSGGSGPTADGRRKPELYAPGCDVDSAEYLTVCGIRTASGTSMASPAVAGSGAIVRQYFEEGWYPSGVKLPGDSLNPSGALVKATLLNATVDMQGLEGYPGPTEGWGRVLLEDGLFFEGDVRRLLLLSDVRNARGLKTGVSDHLRFTVTGEEEPLRLTLVFTEPPADLMASSATVNDLDLEVISPTGRLYRGNNINTDDGLSMAGGEADPINNVEMIVLPEPLLGKWEVTVRGSAVNEGLQGYALVVSGQVKDGQGISLRYADHNVDDSGSRANLNGSADPGETFRVSLELLNLDGVQADGVTAHLYSTRFDLANVPGGVARYALIPSGAAAESLEPHFEVAVSPEAGCGSMLPFRVVAERDGHVDESSFGLRVGRIPQPGAAVICSPRECPGDVVPDEVEIGFDVVGEGTDLTFEWPASSGVTGYQLWRSAEADFSKAELMGFVTENRFVETDGRLSSASWYYRVRATNSCGWEGS